MIARPSITNVEDPSVADIDENGVLRGYKEGKTKISGLVGEFLDTTTVTVEIANAAIMPASDMTGWTIKGSSGITKGALAEDGTLSFTYGSPRAPYIQMVKAVQYYSLPDKLWIEFTPSINISSLLIDLRTPLHNKVNTVEVNPTSGEAFVAGTTHRVEIPISALGDPKDMILYPISLQYIRFNIEANTANKGEQSIKVSELSAEYNNFASVESITIGEGRGVKIYPNPVDGGSFTVTSSQTINKVDVYSVAGANVVSKSCDDNNVTIDASALTTGIYMVTVETEGGTTTSKLIVK